MKDEYVRHLSAPDSMMSDSLSEIISTQKKESIAEQENDILLLIKHEDQTVIRSHRVNYFFANFENFCKVTFQTSKSKILPLQALLKQSLCSVEYGQIKLQGVGCTSWEYNNIENTVTLTFDVR